MKRMLRIFTLLGLMALLAGSPGYASCLVEDAETFTPGQNLRDNRCDRNGALKTTPATLQGGEHIDPAVEENGYRRVQLRAGTVGGASVYSRLSVGTTEDEHEVCSAACTLYSITVTNTNAAVRYLKCFNNLAASTTPGTSTPGIRLAVPGATTGAGITFPFPVGASFSTGLTCWLVTGVADSDVAEVAANELIVLYSYKQ